MRKILHIILLFILILHLGGMLILFSIEQQIVHLQMEGKLKNDTSSFENITLSVSDYEKSSIHSHEILLNGMLYDIKSKTFLGDSVNLIVIKDLNEAKILNHIRQLSNNPNLPKNKFPSQIKLLISLNYIAPNVAFRNILPKILIYLFQTNILDFDSLKPDALVPPPKLA